MNKLLVGIIVLAAGIMAGWYVFTGMGKTQMPRDNKQSETIPVRPSLTETLQEVTPTVMSEAPATAGENKVIVKYSDSGFIPNTITVKKDTTVLFENDSNGAMWVASAVHPTHQLLPGFDQLKSVLKGSTYEYTFVKVGTWKYHNHVKPEETGSVVVTQ